MIHYNKAHLLEEDQYCPFGLKMAGISDKALPVVPNNYLYNGKELQQNEFSDGNGFEDYDYEFRGYDPQIARFTEHDPLTDEFATVSPYQYALNDPVANIDEDGLASIPLAGVTITAKAIHRMSAFSSFTSKLLGEAGLASEAINLSSLGVHVLQVGGVLNAWNITRGIGESAANTAGPASNFLDKNGNLIKHINDGSNAVYQQMGSGYFTHYEFKGFDESQGGTDKVNLTSVIQMQQDLNEANPYLIPVHNETFCNYATQDILNTVGSSVIDGNELRIVGMANTMTTLFGKSPLLKQVTLQVAEDNAKNGGLSLFGYINSGGHGHVGTFSVGENISKGQIANVGAHNGFYPLVSKQIFSQKSLQKVEFFIPKNNLTPIMSPILIPFFNF